MSRTSSSLGLSPLSAEGGNTFTAMTPSAEVTTAAEIITAMKGSLGNLGKTFDSLGEQTNQIVRLGGELETAQHINSVQKQLQAQDKKQEEQIEEIKNLLQEVLQNDIVQHLKELIEQGILSQIDQLVEEQVALQLPHHIPKELQDELASHRRQLEEVQRALHNSESRRANAQLRTARMHDALHTIFKPDGGVSAMFPKDLGSLFSIDDETAKTLMQEYNLPDISDSRERNVNRFMQFCGVSYQLVPTNTGGSLPAKMSMPVILDRNNDMSRML
ncbi:hypothetical protein AcV5_003841 [Taiwanofungus camphoratus]|nr:hypothetical protein AcV5_003841 [Antrodia cinnamomea]